MKTFRVTTKEVHNQDYLVQADSKSDAIAKVSDHEGEIDESSFEYSHMLDQESWWVNEVKVYLINDKAERLSCFVRNDTVTNNQLKFRRNDWMSFSTRVEAQATLDDIIAHCRQQEQAKKLRIEEG